MKIDEVIKPNIQAYKEWRLNEILSVEHKPNETLHPRSLGEGYQFRVTDAGVAVPLASCLAGFLTEHNHQVNQDVLVYGVLPVENPAFRIMGIPILQVIKYHRMVQHGEDVGPQRLGSDVRYVLEPDKNGRDFMDEARKRNIGFLLHEGIHPLRGELPKFIKWLQEVRAIPTPI